MIGGRLVTVQMTVAAASDEVWRALREPAEIARWFGWDCDGLEAEIERIFVSGAQEADDPRRLETGDGTFELEPVPGEPDHTAVRVTRAEPSGEAGADAARVPWGDELTGETYFSTDRQLGLTVDDWGDGLLVLGGGGGGAAATSPPMASTTTGLSRSSVRGKPRGRRVGQWRPESGQGTIAFIDPAGVTRSGLRSGSARRPLPQRG